MIKTNYKSGFTIVEILITVVIIGVLAAAVALSFSGIRKKSRVSAAQSDLNKIKKAIIQLEVDTYKWPFGCEPHQNTGIDGLDLDHQRAGLIATPLAGNTNVGGERCTWTAEDVANWQMAYLSIDVQDPWDVTYQFDGDYVAYRNCANEPEQSRIHAIVSFGPNKTGPNGYDCDDIWISIDN